jgi:hypothetical protein
MNSLKIHSGIGWLQPPWPRVQGSAEITVQRSESFSAQTSFAV